MPTFQLPPEIGGIGAKIHRADRSINDLRVTIDDFLADLPDSYKVRKYFENNDLNYVIVVAGPRVVVPVVNAIVCGEILHHLRACLDHLVVALADKHSGTRSNGHQFPIRTTQQKFDKVVATGCLSGISASALALITASQPFNDTAPSTHFLEVLHQLDIVDKHRVLLVTTAATEMGVNIILNSNGPAKISNVIRGGLRPLSETEQELCRIRLVEPQPGFDANVDVGIKVAIPDVSGLTLPVVDTLSIIREATVDLVAKFVPEFA